MAINKIIRNAAIAALVTSAAFVGTSVILDAPAYAAAARQQQPQGPTPSRRVGPHIVAAQKAYQMMDFAMALAKTADAEMQDGKIPYDDYLIAQLRGMIYIQQQNLPAATPEFDKMLASGAVPEDAKVFTVSTAMKLHYNNKNYPRALELGTQLTALRPLEDTEVQIMGDSYLASMDAAGAAKFIDGVVEAKRAAGQKAPVPVLQQLVNAKRQLMDIPGETAALELLTLADPTPINWRRLLDQDFRIEPTPNEAQLLNLYRLRILVGAGERDDYLGIAQAAMKQGLPEEAKNMLQKGIDTMKLPAADAANLMMQARDMGARDAAALTDLMRAGAAAAEGETDVKAGESLYTYGRFAEAETALRRGIMKGGVKDLANANITLGVVLMAQGKKDEARQAFAAAANSPLAPIAHHWTLYSNG